MSREMKAELGGGDRVLQQSLLNCEIPPCQHSLVCMTFPSNAVHYMLLFLWLCLNHPITVCGRSLH